MLQRNNTWLLSYWAFAHFMSITFNDFFTTMIKTYEIFQLFFNKVDTISIKLMDYINGSVQDCSNSIANALELLQFCDM